MQPFRVFDPDSEATKPTDNDDDPRRGRVPTGGTIRNWRPRVEHLREKYLRHCRGENVHGASRAAVVHRVLDDWCKTYGQEFADTLGAGDLEEWVESHQDWQKSGTRRVNVSVVKAMFRFAARRGYLPSDPFAAVNYKNSQRRPQMTDDVFEAVCRRATKALESILRFLRFTGCRTHEARELEWRDVDLEARVFVVRKHKRLRATGKPAKKALNDEAVSLLRGLLADRPKAKANDLIFRSSRGKPWGKNGVHVMVVKIKKALGITAPGTAHGIRKRFTSAALINGASEKAVAEQLGHADTRMVNEVYAELADETDFMRTAADAAAKRA